MNEECFRQGENITFCRRMQEANTLVKKGLLLGYTDQIDFCPYCGVNIRSPKQPTHEEKWSKAWLTNENNWHKTTGYTKELGYFLGGEWRTNQWFIGRKSADIPPEGKNG